MYALLDSIFQSDLFDNPLVRWSTGLGIFVVTSLVLAGIKHIAARRLESLSEHRPLATLDHAAQVVRKTNFLLYLAVGGWLAMPVLRLTPAMAGRLRKALVILLFLQIGRWISEGITQGLQNARDQAELEEDPSRTTALSALGVLGKGLAWIAIGVLIIDNLGFDITALVASLGIGGIAIALAVQNILGDLFASLSIIVDKPFVNGDFIIVGEFMGTVERIGMKTTRLRSLGGEQLVFSNQDLLQSRIRNYKRMEERRVAFNIGVTYQTATDHVRQIPEMVREIVESTDRTRFDRAHFQQFGQSAFEFEIVYWVLDPDYNVYMDIHQTVILRILEQFRDQDIEIAYPTQTIHMGDATSSIDSVDGRPETDLHTRQDNSEI